MPAILEDQYGKRLHMEFPIYTYSIDYSRHVSNLAYIQWMEAARLTLLEAIGLSVPAMGERGFLPVLTETRIRYHAPLYFGDTAHVDAWVAEFRGASAWVDYRFTSGSGALAAYGRQKGLFVRADTLRPYRFTPEEHALIAPFVRLQPDGPDPCADDGTSSAR